jgi:hypothetical protein
MRKIYGLVKKINCWLASFGVDRYLHLLAGLIISFFVALFMLKVGHETVDSSLVFGMMITVIVGALKEVFDQAYDASSDGIDWLFTCIGGVIGLVLWLL